MGLPPLISYTWLDSQCLETPTSLCSSQSNFTFLVWECSVTRCLCLRTHVCMRGGGALTECFLVTQGTQQVPLVDNCVPDTCLFIGLQIFRTRSKNFYWTISQVRFLSLKSRALTHGLYEDSGISSPACSSLPVPSSGPLCSVKDDYFKFPALH